MHGAEAAPPCAPSSSSLPRPPPVTTQPSRPSATASSPPESPRWSPSSQQPENSSPSSTPSSATTDHGKTLDQQHSRSPLPLSRSKRGSRQFHPPLSRAHAAKRNATRDQRKSRREAAPNRLAFGGSGS